MLQLHSTDLSKTFISLLEKKFNIVALLDIDLIDHDWDILKDIFEKTKKDVYNKNDRYVIVHTDTDYYLPECPYGLSIFNLVRTFLHNDVPLNTLLFITDHKGIKKEFEILIPKDMHEHNFPTIIDDCLLGFKCVRLGRSVPDIEYSATQIVKHGISMIGVPRIHRNMIFNELKTKKLLEKYAISYKGQN